MGNSVPQKYCPGCENNFDATEEFFHKREASKDGLNRLCRICNNKASSEYKKKKRALRPPSLKKEMCPKGHPLVEGNLRKGRRECLTCHREREMQRARKNGVPPKNDHEGFCPNGHPLVEGNLRKGKKECLTCHRESGKRRYHKNPQKMVELSLAYAKAHRDQINKRFRSYRRREDRKVRDRMTSLRGRFKKISDRNTEKAKELYRDEETFIHLTSLYKDPCCYCGEPMEHIDHIDPVANNGAEHWTNLTAACKRCNSRKNDRSLLDFLLYRLEYPDERSA